MNTTMTYAPNSRRNNPAVSLLFLVVLFGVALAIVAPSLLERTTNAMNATKSVTVPKIIENSHADVAHGIWAERTRNACKQHGVSQIWQEKTGAFHFLCFDPIFGWLDWIANKTNNAWEEATAFQPKDGTISSVVEWIKRKGAKWIPLEIFENTLR